MQNVNVETVGNVLVIKVDLTQDFGPSSTGKTISIASTKGNKPIEGTDAIMGLNVYKYPSSK